MTRILAILAVLTVAVCAFGTSTASAGPFDQYTCKKERRFFPTTVLTVYGWQVPGLTLLGYTCEMNVEPPVDEEDPPQEDPIDYCDTLDGIQAEDEDCPPVIEEEDPPVEEEVVPTAPAPVYIPAPAGRTVFCSLTGPQVRGDGSTGIALDLVTDEGMELAKLGVVTPARFYEGLGASCDVLGGYTATGTFVDQAGQRWAEVYPFYAKA